MDINSLVSSAPSLPQGGPNDQVSLAVFKKALYSSTVQALQLIDNLPKPANLPPNLGKNINTKV